MFKHYDENMLTSVEKLDEQYHRSKFIIHKGMFYFAEFDNEKQLKFFAEMLGFTYELVAEEKSDRFGTWRQYKLSHKINDPGWGGFWKREDVPKEAKPFKALSNGSIVTCYFLNDGETINIYRPNPNAKDVYNPLNLQEHLAHRKIYGLV
jgi:hypothetical protein